jgi:hypothetical protein
MGQNTTVAAILRTHFLHVLRFLFHIADLLNICLFWISRAWTDSFLIVYNKVTIQREVPGVWGDTYAIVVSPNKPVIFLLIRIFADAWILMICFLCDFYYIFANIVILLVYIFERDVLCIKWIWHVSVRIMTCEWYSRKWHSGCVLHHKEQFHDFIVKLWLRVSNLQHSFYFEVLKSYHR